MTAVVEAPGRDVEQLRNAVTARLFELGEQYLPRIAWSREQIEAEQRAALVRLLRFAVAHSRWHRARLPQGSCDLAALPVMTKADLMENFDDVVTDRRLTRAAVEDHLESLTDQAIPFMDRWVTLASGGSSGHRGVFVSTIDEFLMTQVALLRHGTVPALVGALAHAAGHETPVRPSPQARLFGAKASHISAAQNTLLQFTVPVLLLPVDRPLSEIVAQLNEQQPKAIMSYPSFLGVLAGEARAGRLRISPIRLTCGGEPLTEEVSAACREAWGVEPVTNYGMTEGLFTDPCLAGRRHIPEDLFMVEPIDEAGRPVPPGVRSAKLYLTSLVNFTQPLIRYEVTDEVVVLPDPCPCGSAFATMGTVEGRLDQVFRYGHIAVHPHVFRSVLGRNRRVIEYQVRQTTAGADVDVCADPDVDSVALAGALEGELRKAGVPGATVIVRRVDRLPRQYSGKLKRFVPLGATAS